MAARKGRQVKQVENLEHHFALELDDASRGETWGERTIRTSWRSRGGQDLAEVPPAAGSPSAKLLSGFVKFGWLKML